MAIATISVVGWHNVGKTSFVERLIRELKARGLRVATIKHSRGDFEIDRQGTDTWRYHQAGSDVVAISGPGRVALIERPEGELDLDDIIARLPTGIDVVITEGFKRLPLPKIEVTTREVWDREGRITPEGQLVALVSDDALPGTDGLPRFARDDAGGVVALLEALGIAPARGSA